MQLAFGSITSSFIVERDFIGAMEIYWKFNRERIKRIFFRIIFAGQLFRFQNNCSTLTILLISIYNQISWKYRKNFPLTKTKLTYIQDFYKLECTLIVNIKLVFCVLKHFKQSWILQIDIFHKLKKLKYIEYVLHYNNTSLINL